MKITFNITKHSPINIEKIELEDVASYEVTDTKIIVKFNGTPDETFSIINNQEGTMGEWFGIESFATRIGLKIDMTK